MDNLERQLYPAWQRGPMQGATIIGEVTEALHKWILTGWTDSRPPPRIEEDLSFVPKDREEVVYVYMYRVKHNTDLMNSKRLRMTKFSIAEQAQGDAEAFYWERPPLYLELNYLVSVHSKFRSDAERLTGWLMLRLHEATHLLYRPRRYLLPDGRAVDSLGRIYDPEAWDDEVVMEKVSMQLSDDLTVGDAINFFTIHEAPYRPYLTYKARCSMEGSLISGPPQPVEVEYGPIFEKPRSRTGRPDNPLDGSVPTSSEAQRTTGSSGRFAARPVRRLTEEKPAKSEEE